MALLKDAIETFRVLGEQHLTGRSLVNLADGQQHSGDLGRALDLLREALPLLDVEREPRVLLNARHDLADLKRLGEEMVPIFSSLQIHREALAALAVLKQAMKREEAGVEMVKAVAEFLERARFEPELRFQR